MPTPPSPVLCPGPLDRRTWLKIGGLSLGALCTGMGPTLAQVLASEEAGRRRQDFSVILFWANGGPSHLETFDLKPDAPAEIRGEFRPIATRVPGMTISEHLPRLARLADLYTIVRSVNHIDNDHAVGTYLMLTGHGHPRSRPLGVEPPASPQDMPSLGSIVSRMRPADRSIFSYVTLGDPRHLGHHDGMGQNAGCLGRAYDPYTVPFVRPINGVLDMTSVTSVMADVEDRQLGQRRSLMQQMNAAAPALENAASMRYLDGFTRRAFELLASPASRNAFNIAAEPQRLRDAYGPTPFGQSCLQARRLVEAGVPLITVYSAGNRDWDTHSDNFNLLKNTLLPPADQGVAALLGDLRDRGMLDETLVVWLSDMGRTPRINSSAGRDHWSFCFSILLAGAGVRHGEVYGSTD